MLKGILNKLFKSKEAQVENPFALFDAYLHNLKAVNDDDRDDRDDDNIAYENLRESSFSVSNEYGEQVEQYNRNVAAFFNLPKIERLIECNNDTQTVICTLKYKHRLISWQEVPNLMSNAFEIFMMSRLIAGDIEIRFDVCSGCQSDHDWYALTPDIWQKLETNYGTEFVRSHFQPMTEEFCEPNYEFQLVMSKL